MAGYRGLISCDGAHFLTGVCISFSILTIMTFILMVLGIILILQRYERSQQVFKRKQILLFLLILTCFTYILYNINRDNVYFYILEYYYYYCYQTYLIYYYSRKAVRGNSHRIYTFMVQVFAAIMFLFFTIEMILHFVFYFVNDRTYKICTDDSISPLRLTAFVMQIIFCFTGKLLEKKFTIMTLDIFSSLNEEERAAHEIKFRKNINQMWRLIIVNIIGATLLFSENILFVVRNSHVPGSGCRIFPHYGEINENNWSDNLNSFFNSLIQLFTNQIPFALTLRIFQLPRQTTVVRQSDDKYDQFPSIVNANFFKGLRLQKAIKQNSSEEISNKRYSPSDSD